MPVKFNKYVGEKYDLLTAIEQVHGNKRKSNKWLFKCDCGNTVTRTMSDVRKSIKSGIRQTCGCHLIKDITGHTFGYLTATKITRCKNNNVMWEFKCECGNIVEKIGSAVYRGEGALHCGCKKFVGGHNFQDLTGNIFGELTVKHITDRREKGHIVWCCECSCGTEVFTRAYYLRRGTKTHCGCKTLKGKHSTSFSGYEEIPLNYFTRIKRGAEARGYDFDITIEFMWELFLKQNKKCHLSGIDIYFKTSKDYTASIDRIDSSKGYTQDNVSWVHKKLNVLKMATPNNEFIEWCKHVAKHNSESK